MSWYTLRLDVKIVDDCLFCYHSEIITTDMDPDEGTRLGSFTGRPEDNELIRCKLNPRSRWRRLAGSRGPLRTCPLPQLKLPKGRRPTTRQLLAVVSEALEE